MALRSTVVTRSFAIAALVAGGCRQRPAHAPSPIAPAEDYCWAYVLTSPLPADSVAARFAVAFAAVGLESATWAHEADTAWALAAPTELPGERAAYSSRVVGYQQGDSTHFRSYVTVSAPAAGWQPADTADGAASRRLIGMCSSIARAAAVHATTPRSATGEEAMSVWRRTR